MHLLCIMRIKPLFSNWLKSGDLSVWVQPHWASFRTVHALHVSQLPQVFTNRQVTWLPPIKIRFDITMSRNYGSQSKNREIPEKMNITSTFHLPKMIKCKSLRIKASAKWLKEWRNNKRRFNPIIKQLSKVPCIHYDHWWKSLAPH